MKISLILSALLSGLLLASTSYAEIQNLDDLKLAFAPLRSEYTALWDRAAQMKVTFVPPTNEISADTCLTYAKSIEAQYKHSPFKVEYKEGSSLFDFCESGGYAGTYAPDHLYFQRVDFKNQFGLPVTYVLQARSFYLNSSLTTLYLDSNYKIVEMAHLVSQSDEAEKNPFEAGVESIDASGNFYLNLYQPTHQNITRSKQAYSSADGKVPTAYRLVRPRRSDKGNEIVQVEVFETTVTKDWNAFDLVLTHAELGGGFYQYGSELFHSPSSFNYLSVTSIGGQPVCTEGYIRRDRTPTAFKADNPAADFGYCGNTW